ncbi:MAG: O-antigen ligase family protein [Paludibacteraceae bacterium]|nr:O-antigen ligase family protein [Paludibacteraceae bacterium]
MWLVVKKQIILFVILFILFTQTMLVLDFIPILDVLFSGLRILVFFVLFFCLYLRHFYFTKIEYYLLLYAIFLGGVSLLYSDQKTMFFFQFINITTLLIIFKFFDFRDILVCATIILSFFVYLNFLLTLMSPSAHFYIDGKAAFILGRNYNSMGPVLLAAIITNAFYFYNTRRMLWNLVMISIISFFTVQFMGSMTSTVGIGLTVFFMFFSIFKGARLSLSLFLVFILFFNFILLYLQMEIDNNYAVWFVEDILGKDMTFTDRARVWFEAVNLILDSPVLGYGIQSPEWFDYHFNVLSAHNFILTMLLKGGFILLGLFIAIMVVSVKKANENINSGVTFLQFGCCSFLLMMTMESYSMMFVFYYLFLNYFSVNLYLEDGEHV